MVLFIQEILFVVERPLSKDQGEAYAVRVCGWSLAAAKAFATKPTLRIVFLSYYLDAEK
jgi:hypothetical protein